MPHAMSIDASPAPVCFNALATAVLVIDMQNDFGSPGGMFDRAGISIAPIRAIVPNVARVLDAARHAGLKVIYIKMGFRPDLSDMGATDAPNRLRHERFGVGQIATAGDKQWRILIRDDWGTDILDELRPHQGDVTVWKHRFSAFYETELHALLQAAGIKHLIVTGCTTSICVDATVRDAFYRDYHCVLIEDCMAEPIAHDAERTNHEATLLAMQLLFGWTSTSDKFIATIAADG